MGGGIYGSSSGLGASLSIYNSNNAGGSSLSLQSLSATLYANSNVYFSVSTLGASLTNVALTAATGVISSNISVGNSFSTGVINLSNGSFNITPGIGNIGEGANYTWDQTNQTFKFNSSGNITLTPTGNVILGSNAKVKITGGSSSQVLSTDGAGNLSWVAQSGGSSTTDFTASFLLGGM